MKNIKIQFRIYHLFLLLFSSNVYCVTSYRCDSVITKNALGIKTYKSFNAFDSLGNKIEIASYFWDNTKACWQGVGCKWLNTFDTNGNQIIQLTYIWNSTLSSWEIETKQMFGYDSLNKVIRNESYTWIKSSQTWIKGTQYEYNYDTFGNQILEIYSEWNDSLLSCINNKKTEYRFNTNGEQTLKTISYWDNKTSSWISSYNYESVFNSNDSLTLSDTYQWNKNDSTWYGVNKEEYSYDSLSNKILKITYYWNTDSNKWMRYNKFEFTFDKKSNQTQKAVYSWNVTKGIWEGITDSKWEYVYDSASNIIHYLSYTWDSTSVSWRNKYKWDYTYDSSSNAINCVIESWDTTSYSWKNNTQYKFENIYNKSGKLISNITSQIDSSSHWINKYKYEYNYDSLGRMTLDAYYITDTSNSWVGITKHENAYDSYGNKTLYAIYQQWDKKTESWIGFERDEYQFDSLGNKTVSIRYGWNNGWTLLSRQEFAFNNFGNYISKYYYTYDIYSKTLIAGEKDEFLYNNDGIIIKKDIYNWDLYNNIWKLTTEDDSYYTTVNICFTVNCEMPYLSSKESSSTSLTINSNIKWNVSSNQTWLKINQVSGVGNKLVTLTANATDTERIAILSVSGEGIPTQEVKIYQMSNDTILKLTKTSVLFEDTLTTDTIIVKSNYPWTASSDQTWLTISPSSGVGIDTLIITAQKNTMSSNRTAIITVSENAIELTKANSFQTITVTQNAGKVTSKIETISNDLLLFPNPAKTSFVINSDENLFIQVFTMAGDLIFSKNVLGNEIVSTENLSSGLYLIKISSNTSIDTRRLIIIK